MRLENIASIYVAIVELEENIRSQAPDLADETGSLRADIHALFMEALRDRGIPFRDRSEAADLAYQLARSPLISP
jgi:hypothetical protein